MKLRIAFRGLALLVCSLFLVTLVFGQADSQQDDLAAAARKARARKAAKAKTVISDDDLAAGNKSEFPELQLEGANNCDTIVARVKEYKATHTPAETEAAVRTWFEQHSGKLSQLVQEVRDLAEREIRRSGSSEDGETSSAQMHAVEQDHARIREDLATARRLQQDLKFLVSSFKRMSLEYDLRIPDIKVSDVVEE